MKTVKLTEDHLVLLENIFALALDCVHKNEQADAMKKKQVSKEIHNFEDFMSKFIQENNHDMPCNCGQCEKCIPF